MYKVIRHDGTGVVSSNNKQGNKWHYKSNGRFASVPETIKTAGNVASSTANSLESYGRNMYTRRPRKDLSSLSDQELQQILNRERMERQYDDMFNPPRETMAKKFLDGTVTALRVVGLVAPIIAAGYSIYKSSSSTPMPSPVNMTDDELRDANKRMKAEMDFYRYTGGI